MANSEITGTVKAEDVPEGAFLLDLNNGYVFDAVPVNDFYTIISFHDAEGDECSLTVPNDFELNVRYEA
jgi:hypothetical protein